MGTFTYQNRIHLEEWSHGPLQWNVKCSVELQHAVDLFNKDWYNELRFSVTVADPKAADHPLIACSAGFADLTGYSLPEIVGRNCRFLLNGVPASYINEETRMRSRDFCQCVFQGGEYENTYEVLPPGVKSFGYGLPRGELICVQVNAMKSGELFRNMFYMKQVVLDGHAYILGLQAGIPEQYEDGSGMEELQKKCELAWRRLGDHMTNIEMVLAARFWYTGSMRRQD